jgi:hypothetical protein
VETPEQIEQKFIEADWSIDNGSPGYLVIGYSGDTLSILARRQELFVRDDEDHPLFEILDHARDVTY